METVIVYIDDAAYARQQLTPPDNTDAIRPQGSATHWVLVACAPRMTHRISKWVSHSARENWRAKWSDKLYAEISPWLRQRGDRVTEVVAKGPLVDLSAQLQMEHRGARVLDGRRPKLNHDMQPAAQEQQPGKPTPWKLPGAVASIFGMMLVLGAE